MPNGAIYAAEDDALYTGLSFVSSVPLIGNSIGGAKLSTAGIGVIDAVTKFT